mmetsp:Transcript_10867/g.30050  ORF Transcript_10867/g.30050 Transcript_10867/m.30050 type:complete len:103 (+) Transcript_10867:1033-1341(+)
MIVMFLEMAKIEVHTSRQREMRSVTLFWKLGVIMLMSSTSEAHKREGKHLKNTKSEKSRSFVSIKPLGVDSKQRPGLAASNENQAKAKTDTSIAENSLTIHH